MGNVLQKMTRSDRLLQVFVKWNDAISSTREIFIAYDLQIYWPDNAGFVIIEMF